MRHSARGSIIVVAFVTASASGMAAANASVRHDTMVSEDPVNVTPNVESDNIVPNPAVHALGRIGTTMYAGGTFRTVTNASGTQTYTRYNLMAFDAGSGTIKRFAPQFNGTVWAVRPKGSALYVGGDFTRVNGVFRRGLVKIDAKTGEVRRTFRPRLKDGSVTEIRLVNERLIIGGSFPKRLAALRLDTGSDTRYIQSHIIGRLDENSGDTKVYRFAVNPARNRLVAIGNFTSVGGVPRLKRSCSDWVLGSQQSPAGTTSRSTTRVPMRIRPRIFVMSISRLAVATSSWYRPALFRPREELVGTFVMPRPVSRPM